ncbi:MAG: mitochondrial fission ELM1 family protein [Candidatus Binatia bacterium]
MNDHSEKRASDTPNPHVSLPLPPTVWVLADDRPGNTSQSVGLAQALGWSFTVKELQFTRIADILKFLLGPFAATRLGLATDRSATLAPPWPQIVIAAGWRPAQLACWIKRRSGGQTRLVHLGRKGGHVAALFDVVVSCSYFHLPPHPRRIEVAAPLTRISSHRLQEAAQHWHRLVANAQPPYIMTLVGGATSRHQFDTTIAQRLGEELRSFTETIGGSLFVTTSRRTTAPATAALKSALGEKAYLHEWQPGLAQDNPYMAFLALADVLIVTGESESMLAEAMATGKPFYIYPLPEKTPSQSWRKRLKVWVKDTVVASAYDHNQSDGRAVTSGTRARFCRWLIASGIVRPRRDLHELHQALIRRGSASLFGTPLPSPPRPLLCEIDEVAHKVKTLLGFQEESVDKT